MRHGARFLSQLQSQAPAPAEPAHAQHRDTDDCRLAAAALRQLALGVAVLHRGLDLAIRGTRDRGKSTCLFQEPRLPSGWTTLGTAPGRSCVWLRQAETVRRCWIQSEPPRGSGWVRSPNRRQIGFAPTRYREVVLTVSK